MVDAKILNSEWVIPKGPNEWGFKLKPGAPESVKREFEAYQNAVKRVHEMASGKRNQ